MSEAETAPVPEPLEPEPEPTATPEPDAPLAADPVPATTPEPHPLLVCDRAMAREARRTLKERVLEPAAAHGAEITAECALHPSHDHVLPQEAHRKMQSHSNWRCLCCGKTFRSEYYLDMHLDRRHSAEVAGHACHLQQNASVCLGDYCDMLRCPSWLATLRRKRTQTATLTAACRPGDVQF